MKEDLNSDRIEIVPPSTDDPRWQVPDPIQGLDEWDDDKNCYRFQSAWLRYSDGQVVLAGVCNLEGGTCGCCEYKGYGARELTGYIPVYIAGSTT